MSAVMACRSRNSKSVAGRDRSSINVGEGNKAGAVFYVGKNWFSVLLIKRLSAKAAWFVTSVVSGFSQRWARSGSSGRRMSALRIWRRRSSTTWKPTTRTRSHFGGTRRPRTSLPQSLAPRERWAN